MINRKSSYANIGSKCRRAAFVIAVMAGITVMYFTWRFGVDSAVTYTDIREHFKYGSTGGERESGFPYWIFAVLPDVCPEYLPGKGYQSLGLLFEKDGDKLKDLPIGMSKRRVTGLDRVFLNCAVCHVGTVRDTPESDPKIILGMPANNLNVMNFQNFFFNCAKDAKFSADYIIPVIDEKSGGLSFFDKNIVYPIAISLMRDGLISLASRFTFADHQPEWGPGRVDTFNAAKAIFSFSFKNADPAEMIGTADLPSIWNQAQRQGMQLHWDGNNTMVEERNKSAAFGTGTTPPTIDLGNIKRIEDWLLGLTPPEYPYPIDKDLADKGAPIYKAYCSACHGANGSHFEGDLVGKVTPIDKIATDRWRLDSYTYELAVNQSTLYAGYPWRFTHFRKTFGYANMPLDGLWLRAPYLHNGSVPTIRDLLNPASERPKIFFRGNDVYDKSRLGFESSVAAYSDRNFFRFDTGQPGNSNTGHEGKPYGTELSNEEKDALVEYLKTF